MSKSIEVANLVTDLINTTLWPWPWLPSFTGVDPAAPWLLTDEVTARSAVVPQLNRIDIGVLQVLVSTIQRNNTDAYRDRCLRKFNYIVDVGVVQRFDQADLDTVQPGTLAEIDSLISFAESVSDLLDQTRSLSGASLTTLNHTLYQPTLIEKDNIFVSSIQATYEYN